MKDICMFVHAHGLKNLPGFNKKGEKKKRLKFLARFTYTPHHIQFQPQINKS